MGKKEKNLRRSQINHIQILTYRFNLQRLEMLKMGYIILEVYIQIQRRVRQNNSVVQASLKVSSNR